MFSGTGGDGSGTAALEFGLTAPLLVLLAIGTIEVGTATYEAMQAQSAAEAGAVWVSKNGYDEAGIVSAITSATGATGVTASSEQFCGCPEAAGITNAGAPPCADITCSGGGDAGTYARISAQITHYSVIPVTGLEIPATFTGQAIVRLK